MMKTTRNFAFLRRHLGLAVLLLTGLCIATPATAQLPYDFDFTSDPFANGWNEESVSGAQSWTYNASFSNASMSAFSGGCQVNEDWLITPAFDLSSTSDELLSFDIQRGFNGDNGIEVLYSTDYSGTGDPNAATWTAITTVTSQYFTDNSIPNNTSETFGGFTDLQSASSSAVHVAFKFDFVSGNCSTWRVAGFSLISASSPSIFASTASISGLDYLEEEGPSASQSYNITGLNLTGSGNIAVSAPSGFEVSLDDASFGGSVDVAFAGGTITGEPVTVYTRLAAGQAPGTYDGNITHSGGGASAEVAVEGTVTAAPTAGTYFVDFEGADETKGSYASGNVTLSGLEWNMTEALIGTLSGDFKNGDRSARLRGYGTSSFTMLQDKPGGIGNLSFVYARYGSDSQVPHVVEYSTDGGTVWTQIGDTIVATATPTTFFEEVNVAGDARIRFRSADETGTSNRRINFDDITMTDFGAAEAQLFASPAQLQDLNYTVGQGPSAEDSYVLSASSLSPAAGNISVSAPAGFEVSSDNVSWSSSLSIAYSDNGATITEDVVYVRLAEGQAVGSYSADVSNTAGDATADVNVSGEVLDSPLPELFNLSAGDYSLTEWSSESEAGTFPANMRFLFSENPTSSAYNPLADGTGLYNCAYNTPSRSRINGNDDQGFSFIATGSAQYNNCESGAADGDRYVGSAVLGINTSGVSFARVSWLNRVVTEGDRPFVVRLQYRLGASGDYTDFAGNPEFASTGTMTGDSATTDFVLPSEVLNQSEVYLRLVYFQNGEGGGTRPELGVDDFLVTTSPLTSALLSASVSSVSGLYYTDGNGPSDPQTYTLTGQNLEPATGFITVVAEGDFEISLDGVAYDTLLTIGYGGGAFSEDISVRLNGDLEVGTYSGGISHEGGDASSVNIAVSGEVGYPVNLETADIAIIGFRSVANDGLAFAAWTDIPDGTVILFTDNAFTGSELRTNENTAVWQNTSGSAIAAGTVVKIGGPELGDGIGADIGTLISGSLNGLAQGGDNIFAIQGSLSQPVWLHGLSYLNDWLTEGFVSNSTSYLPAALDIPFGNVVITERNAEYDDTREGASTFAAYQVLVHDAANWRVNEDGALFGDFNTTPFVINDAPCAANGGTLTALSSRSVCVGTGAPQGVNVQVSGAVGDNARWGLIAPNGDILDTRLNNSQFNLDGYAPGNYQIRYIRYADDVSLAGLTNVSQLSNLEGCWDASNAITVFLRNEPNGGTLTAQSPTTVCADNGSTTGIAVSLSGATGENSRFGLRNLSAPGNPIVAQQAGTTFNLNGFAAGTYEVRHLAYQDGVEVSGSIQFQSELSGCFAVSNGITVSLVNCGAAQLTSSPNPTAGQSFVTFTNPREETASLEVYDMSGRLVSTLFRQTTQPDAEYRLEFDGAGLPNGVYIYRLTTESEIITDKFMIAR